MPKRNIKFNQGVNFFYQLQYFKNYDNFMVYTDSFLLVLDKFRFLLTRVRLVLIRVDSCQTRVALVLIRVDMCWYSCIRTDLIIDIIS